MLSWLCLVIAICFEVAGTTCMKLSDGFTKAVPSVLIFVFYALCFVFLTMAIKKIDLSIAYTIWAGAGTALITIISLIHFDEPLTLVKGLFITLIIIGVVGLNFYHHTQ